MSEEWERALLLRVLHRVVELEGEVQALMEEAEIQKEQNVAVSKELRELRALIGAGTKRDAAYSSVEEYKASRASEDLEMPGLGFNPPDRKAQSDNLITLMVKDHHGRMLERCPEDLKVKIQLRRCCACGTDHEIVFRARDLMEAPDTYELTHVGLCETAGRQVYLKQQVREN